MVPMTELPGSKIKLTVNHKKRIYLLCNNQSNHFVVPDETCPRKRKGNIKSRILGGITGEKLSLSFVKIESKTSESNHIVDVSTLFTHTNM